MKTKFLIFLTDVSLVTAWNSAFAADATWNVNGLGTWGVGSNWTPAAAPGTTSGTTSTDTATFGSIITGGKTVTVDTNRNILGINFFNTQSAYTLSGGSLLLTNGGLIQTSGTATASQTISTAIAIQGDGGAATFSSNATGTNPYLLITPGGVTGVSTLGNTTTLTLDGATAGTSATASMISAVIGDGSNGGKLQVVKNGTGYWKLAPTTGNLNTFTGGLQINAGTVYLGGSVSGAAGTGLITLGGSTGNALLELASNNQSNAITIATGTGTRTILQSSGGNISLTGAVALNADLIVDISTKNLSFGGTGGGAITGSNTIIVRSSSAGGGTFSIGGSLSSSSFTGTVQVDANGTFVSSNAAGSMNITAATVNVKNGGRFNFDKNATIGGLNGEAGSLVNASSSSTLTLAGTGTYTLNGSIQNATGFVSTLTKTGSGTQTLTGSNSYTGVTTVTGGTLDFTKQAALYAGTSASWVKTSITVGSGATLAFGVGDSAGGYFDSAALDTLQTNLKTSISTNGFKAGSIMGFDTTNASSGTFTYNTAVTDSTGTGSGAIGLAKLGAGSLVLGGTSTYTGGTTIKAGTLALGSSGAVGSSGNITFSGGSLQFTSSNTTDYAARIKNSASAVALDTNGQAVNLGVIDSTNTAGLTKSGAGTLTLTGTNTYTGVTLVTTGTLVVNGTLQNGGVTVNSGATLKGGITAGGTTTILSGGTLSVGNSPGIANFETLSLAGTDIMEFNASPNRGSAGTAYDTINISAALTYGGELRLSFAGLVSSDAVTPFTLFQLGSVTPTGSFGSVTIYGFGGTQAASLTNSSGVWTGLANLGYGGGQQSFSFTQANGGLIVAVPEPSTWALLAFSLTTVMVLRRRRD